MDLGGEAEKATVGAGVGFVSAAGQTAFLVGALQCVHGPVLQVGGLLYNLSTEDKVWGRWERENNKENSSYCESQKITRICFLIIFVLSVILVTNYHLPTNSTSVQCFVFYCFLL